MSCCVKVETNLNHMAKIYSKKTLATTQMQPKKEIISFLLNYSKALNYIKVKGLKFESIAN